MSSPENTFACRRLLILDDEPRILAALKEVLERAGYQIVATTRPDVALDRLKGERFGVLISDQLMPGMTGLEFFKEAQRLQPNASRVLITGVTSLPTLVDAINQGEIFRFLAKPWLREELLITISNGVDRNALLMQNEILLNTTSQLNESLAKANTTLQAQVTQLASQGKELTSANQELKLRYDHSLELCSRILATYDPLLAGQTKAIAGIVEQMNKSSHLSPQEREALTISAWLCDIGLIGFSRELFHSFLRHPERLTEREIASIHSHPTYSQTLATFVDGRHLVGETVRAHHERFDGKGYPDHLAGETIPWTARCLAVAVYFVECRLPTEQALDAVQKAAGTALDPEAVRLFRTTTHLHPLPRSVSEVMLEDLKPGMVLASGIYSPHGMLLVGEGQALNPGTISKIQNHNFTAPICQRLLVYS